MPCCFESQYFLSEFYRPSVDWPRLTNVILPSVPLNFDPFCVVERQIAFFVLLFGGNNWTMFIPKTVVKNPYPSHLVLNSRFFSNLR